MISIAIIDVIGLTYDGSTLQKRGLGGSESAVILMAKELKSLGLDVTVFNNCIDREASPGIYDGVKYIDLTQIQSLEDPHFDVVIASRTVVPFLPPDIQNWHRPTGAPLHEYHKIRKHAKLKAVWMHDTFCDGDQLVEDLVVHGFIDELFTLSDFHTSYVTNCDHGRKRMFEVLKNKIFMTRNGVVNYHDEVDIAAKDPNLFVYNASVTKGMIPLVEKIWPVIKQHIPQAELKVIGGYYRFRENAEPDEQEKTWRIKANDPGNPAKGIEYTGIIKQSEIANILAKSSFMIYPGAFPETFGISSLESLTYNTPLITTRFGALEETAVNQACYMIDYPIVPNGLFPAVNEEHQVNRFIETALRAHSDKYLHQQKMYMCSIVKDVCTWDTVALQWKQHFYKKLNHYLSKDEYRKVSRINSRVQEVFGRRFTNPEEVYIPRKTEQRIVVVTPTYNAENYIEKCIQSVVTQDYDNWHMYIIDDCSTDSTLEVIDRVVGETPNITVIRNNTNKGAPYNHVSTIKQHCNPDDIIMLIDGDDALVNSNQIFHYYNNLYDGTTEFSYGSCWSMVDSIPLIAQHYPKHVKENRSYRNHRFNWNMPYTHLRTFKAGLLLTLDDSNFQDEDGKWYKAGGDGAVFYSVIEKADPAMIKIVQDVVYLYNDASPINDYKVNGDEQTRNANKIIRKLDNKDKFSVIIPTMWRAVEYLELYDHLVNCDLVGEVIIINNDPSKTPLWLPTLSHPKIVMINQETNIMVNPAWNIGVEVAKYDRLCFCNDDIVFDPKLFEKIYDRVTPEYGPHGIIWGKEDMGQPPTTDGSIEFMQWRPGFIIHCFGQLFFQHKSNWVPIMPELKLYFGDDWVLHHALLRNKVPWLIYNTFFRSTGTITALQEDIKPLSRQRYEIEAPIYSEWLSKHPVTL